MIVLGLARGNMIVIACTAIIFIAFALVSAFVLPRRSPNFPNQNVGWFVFASLVLFVAMLTSILVFGVEEEGEAKGEPAAETQPAETGGTETEPTETGQTETGQTETGPAGGGDAAAGKEVFASAGCGGCHTLGAAGSSGNVGPNLDDAKPDVSLIEERVTNGMGPMPSFKDQLSPKQIHDVAAFVYSSTHS
jgi:mono/diheme cytochrome c family protein